MRGRSSTSVAGAGRSWRRRAASGRPMAGVDIAMRWLIVARKRLDEEGSGRHPARLRVRRAVCRSPIGHSAAIVAGDVIEHVADQAATSGRGAPGACRGGGRLFLASPNRFSLAPEPHVQVWGVGYLPRRWMVPYVRWTSGRDFRAIRTLGVREWTQFAGCQSFRGMPG